MKHTLVAAVVVASLWAHFSQAAPQRQADTEQIDLPVVRSAAFRPPEGLSLRVRVVQLTPREPTAVAWRHGGEGQGGDVIRGRFGKPGTEADRDPILDVGQWSTPTEVLSLVEGSFPGKLFLTVTAGRPGRVVDRVTGRQEGYSTDVVFEFEFLYRDRVVKRFSEAGPDGGTATIVIPAYCLVGDVRPDSPEFLDELGGVLEYATRRAEFLEGLPWAEGPLPQKYVVVNNAGGYGVGYGYSVRTTNPAVARAELRSLRQLGTNALRDPPEFLIEKLRSGDPQMRPFARGWIVPVMGFPVPVHREGRPADPEAGCPLAEGIAERTRAGVEESLEKVRNLPVGEVWGLTVDEIGTVVDRSPEGKAHLSVCPRCAEGFRRWLKQQGVAPEDFGRTDWSDVRPVDVWAAESTRPWLADPHAAAAAYWTRAFNNYVTARLFTPLRDAFAAENASLRAGPSPSGQPNRDPPRPRIYCYALRGNTFLMKGHSLDFFDFYREADNAIVYETSNREPRIWAWDSYLCDVQRIVGEKMDVARGIYIKPHRGAPLQRMLSAVGRGNTMIYWYTYGPDYKKGDSFSQDRPTLALTSKAAHLLGKAEDALYGSTWAVPAEIAVVKPETTQRWMNLCGNPPHLAAAWENAKWVYTALQHAHLPVDPIDERILATEDLSRYKAIYVSGSHVTRAAAEGLRRYVERGGTLCTSGWGLARDEANRPLTVLEPVLGLKGRREPEMWYEVELYGASGLEPYDDAGRRLAPVPSGTGIEGRGSFEGRFDPVIGREVLEPVAEADVPARFADGSAAVVRHAYGKGEAYVVGFFPGLEYSATVRRPDYDMRRDFDPVRRRFIAAPVTGLTRPVVDASDPLVEGVLLRCPDGVTRAVTLANWAYGVTAMREDARGRLSPVVDHLPVKDLEVTIRGAGAVTRARSTILDQPLKLTRHGDQVTIVVPELAEGDVLLLD